MQLGRMVIKEGQVEAVLLGEQSVRAFAFVYNYCALYHHSPSVREVGRAIGVSSSATVHVHLRRLRRMGMVDWVDGQTRTLHPVVAVVIPNMKESSDGDKEMVPDGCAGSDVAGHGLR